MITKARREEILKKIQEQYPYTTPPSALSGSPMGGDLTRMVNEAVKFHVDRCFEILINELYTHEDFEGDLKL